MKRTRTESAISRGISTEATMMSMQPASGEQGALRARGRGGRSQPERPYVPRFSLARARFCWALADVGSRARAR